LHVLEVLLAAVLLVVLGAAVAAALLLPWEVLLVVGFSSVAVGLLVGLPTGFVYHLKLRACLLRTPPLPRRWWLSPTRLHDRLAEAERGSVLAWCYWGAAGFFSCLFGAAVIVLGLIAMW
jgi:hypothetical protein